jgi:aminopeptidase N
MTPVLRKDYAPPAWWIDRVDLECDLEPCATRVKSRLSVRRNPQAPHAALHLNGEALETLALRVNGQPQDPVDCLETPTCLRIDLDEGLNEALIETEVRCDPMANKTLDGLFMSNGGFFTQCEPEGFRRITWFCDRPDIVSQYRVRLEAEATAFPILLSNGHLLESGPLPEGRHYALWEDPFPKPCYLFALVAARLVALERTLHTASGRKVCLQVWVQAHEKARAGFALDCLEAALRWDETRFGLELDLDRYMIVATHDFNLGAMENKGLNLFNAQYVLADPETATDTDFANIESIIAHEYFHNWTGNRVTCKSWFELTLKEGLTVFRDQWFSSDRLAWAAKAGGAQAQASARAVKRIEDIRFLHAVQFAEDEGPMCHAVRPDRYEEINNFYTATVYEKGAEIIGMLHAMVGDEGFVRGVRRYLSDFDGQAVDCEAFVDAMSRANEGLELHSFMAWYDQAGPVHLELKGEWDAPNAHYRLTATQTRDKEPNAPPLPIPFAVGLLTEDGKALPLQLAGEAGPGGMTQRLILKERHQTWVFQGVDASPVLSAPRTPVPPVRVVAECPLDHLFVRFEHDTDPCAQWQAGQTLLEALIFNADLSDQRPRLWRTWAAILESPALEPAFKAVLLTLPPEKTLFQRALSTGGPCADPQTLRTRLIAIEREAGEALTAQWKTAFETHRSQCPWHYTPYQAGQRALRHRALQCLCAAGIGGELAFAQFEAADNMTDRLGALSALVNSPHTPAARQVLQAFEARHHEHTLVMNKWFAVQARAWRFDPALPPLRHKVEELLEHRAFEPGNPNRIQSLLGVFFRENIAEFHDAEGRGYALWARKLREIDRVNPQQAARLARALENAHQYPRPLQNALAPVLESLMQESLSPDLGEVLRKMSACSCWDIKRDATNSLFKNQNLKDDEPKMK